jgi:predicted XRE-type DNA-binding protein
MRNRGLPSVDKAMSTPEGKAAYETQRLRRSVARQIEELLSKLKISQERLAEMMGVSPGRVSQILAGDQNLTLRSLATIGSALGASVNVMITRDDLNAEGMADRAPAPAPVSHHFPVGAALGSSQVLAR